MLTIEIINDGTGTNAEGNYNYRVLVNGEVIDEGRVEGHTRAAGWAVLAGKVAADADQRRTLQMYAKVAELMMKRDASRG